MRSSKRFLREVVVIPSSIATSTLNCSLERTSDAPSAKDATPQTSAISVRQSSRDAASLSLPEAQVEVYY